MANILVLEDEARFREIIVDLLEGVHEVFTAANSNEVLEELAKNEIDLLLSDVNLADSELQGNEVMALVGETHPQVAVIAMTGGITENEQLIRDAGVDIILQKPFTREALLNAIDEILRTTEEPIDVTE